MNTDNKQKLVVAADRATALCNVSSIVARSGAGEARYAALLKVRSQLIGFGTSPLDPIVVKIDSALDEIESLFHFDRLEVRRQHDAERVAEQERQRLAALNLQQTDTERDVRNEHDRSGGLGS